MNRPFDRGSYSLIKDCIICDREFLDNTRPNAPEGSKKLACFIANELSK